MAEPAAILCAELARALGVHVRAPEMVRALAVAKLALELLTDIRPGEGRDRVRGSSW